MFHQYLADLADFVTKRRLAVLSVMAVLTLVSLAGIPRLEIESSPENFIISFGDYEQRVRAFRSRFGDTDNVMMLLVEAEDVTSLEALRYQHTLARRFATEPMVLRVDGLTVTPLPRGRGAEAAETGESLDDLALEEEPPADPEVEAALQTLVSSEPERFPSGLYDVAERVTDADREPIVPGDEVEARHVEIIRAAVAESPLVVGRLISADHTLAGVVVRLREEIGTGNERVAFVDRVDEWLDANPPPEGIHLHRAGLPHLRTAIVRHMARDQRVLVPTTVLVCVILLFLSFRWIPATILPLLAVGICVVMVVGTMAWFGEPMTILSNVLPTLIIIIELSNAVHLITRWEEELRRMRRADSVEAAARAMRTMAAACFLTSFTSAVGLGSLLVSETQMLRRFGGLAAAGTMLAYTVTIFAIPALLSYLKPPRSLPSPATSEEGHKRRGEPAGWIERGMVHGTRAVLRRPWTVLFVTALLSAPVLYAAGLVQVDTSLSDTFEHDDPVAVSVRLMDERMDGIRPLEILLTSDQAHRLEEQEVVLAIIDFERWASEREGVLRATSYPDYLLSAWQRLGDFERPPVGTDPHAAEAALRDVPLRTNEQVRALRTLLSRVTPDPIAYYLTEDGTAAHVEMRIGDIGARRSSALIEEIQAEAERRFEPLGLEVSVTGEAYIGSRGIESVVRDLVGSLGLSVLLIFATLVLLFRSVRYAVIAVPPNVLPLFTTMAWMVVRGIPLNAGTAVVFSIAVGVGVDGTIHALARFREEEAAGHRRNAAIVRTARGTGRAVVISALTLMLGFASFLLSSFVPIQHFGELIAAAMTASLVSTLAIQPALVKLFGGPDPAAKAKPKPSPKPAT
ncbi:MAG: efflux RND transporter permease subunit [Sandaracinus sp.]